MSITKHISHTRTHTPLCVSQSFCKTLNNCSFLSR